uniref:Uncharacterized protein n=1 Tax=Engystomops pustulosus TaxID=76066 RepID=A0AAV6YMX8_ENGPU|nr:hypothetical protein GDO81_022400 [Engystomops pustulosus]
MLSGNQTTLPPVVRPPRLLQSGNPASCNQATPPPAFILFCPVYASGIPTLAPNCNVILLLTRDLNALAIACDLAAGTRYTVST